MTIGTGTGIDGRGMAYDDNHGILFAMGPLGLYAVNTTTGTASFMGSMGIDTGRLGLAYDESTDTCFCSGPGWIRTNDQGIMS